MKVKKLIIASLLIMGFYACEKDNTLDAATVNISGKWFQERTWDDSLIFQEVYDFKTNRTVQITGSVIESGSNKIQGYVKQLTGTFNFKGDSLILKDLKLYSVRTHTYKKLEELDSLTTYKRESYKVTYNTDKDTLTLEFYCPPNADCVPNPQLTKLK